MEQDLKPHSCRIAQLVYNFLFKAYAKILLFFFITYIGFAAREVHPVYYGYTSYTGFNSGSNALAGAGTKLSLRFKFCSPGGILLHVTGDNERYFSMGVNDSGQLLVDFSDEEGVRVQVIKISIMLGQS